MSDQPSAADEIMDGVHRALCAHGYADLTMQDIADECSKSKSLLHYHYDTKQDLLVAFLDHVISDSERRIAAHADGSPAERLAEFIGWFVFEPDAVDREAFHIALLELRTQGPFNEPIRERLARSDRLLRGTVVDILESGIEEGVFRDVDAEETAALLVATLDGARTRQITLSGGVDTAERSGSDAVGIAETADHPEPVYTRVVAEAAFRRLVEPLLADGAELPSLEAGIAAMMPVDAAEDNGGSEGDPEDENEDE